VAKIIFHERAALGRSEDTEQALLVVSVRLHRTVDDIFAAAGEAQLSVTLTEAQVPKRHPTSIIGLFSESPHVGLGGSAGVVERLSGGL
jgi:hypothetical protein